MQEAQSPWWFEDLAVEEREKKDERDFDDSITTNWWPFNSTGSIQSLILNFPSYFLGLDSLDLPFRPFALSPQDYPFFCHHWLLTQNFCWWFSVRVKLWMKSLETPKLSIEIYTREFFGDLTCLAWYPNPFLRRSQLLALNTKLDEVIYGKFYMLLLIRIIWKSRATSHQKPETCFILSN